MPHFPADSNDDGTIPGQTQRESDPQKQQDEANASNQRVCDLQDFLMNDPNGNGWHSLMIGNRERGN
jgi:hypothetical protein